MDLKGNAETTIGQPLQPEYNTQQEAKGATENPVSQKTTSLKDKQANVHRRGAARMAGFLFWANFAGVLLLLVGFVAPGWLTVRASQRLHKSSSYSSESGSTINLYVYQDYALWYITQCYDHDGSNNVCETMTYRTIDDVYRDENSDFEKIEIGKMEKSGKDRFMFHGAGLVFNFSAFVRAQTLYTIGLLVALFTLYRWYQFRADVAHGKHLSLSKKKWALLLILTALCALFVLVPAILFAVVRGDIGGKDTYPSAKIDTSFGSVFAGFGGGMMVLIAIIVFMQLVCCRKKDAYICSCADGSDAPARVVEG